MEGKIVKSLIQTSMKNILPFPYGYKLVSVDDKFSKPFKTYLDKDAVYFINSMIKESKYCIDIRKRHFIKELVMTKEGN